MKAHTNSSAFKVRCWKYRSLALRKTTSARLRPSASATRSTLHVNIHHCPNKHTPANDTMIAHLVRKPGAHCWSTPARQQCWTEAPTSPGSQIIAFESSQVDLHCQRSSCDAFWKHVELVPNDVVFLATSYHAVKIPFPSACKSPPSGKISAAPFGHKIQTSVDDVWTAPCGFRVLLVHEYPG